MYCIDASVLVDSFMEHKHKISNLYTSICLFSMGYHGNSHYVIFMVY